MTYTLTMFKNNGCVSVNIEDKDTLWLIMEAMLDNRVECSVIKRTLTDEEIWEGKGESRRDIV